MGRTSVTLGGNQLNLFILHPENSITSRPLILNLSHVNICNSHADVVWLSPDSRATRHFE